MLARAAAKGLEVVEADAQQLPFENESFDAAMMISMLHHVEDRVAALTEARHILRTGGRLVLKGLARLRGDIQAGRAPRRAGTATVLSWTKR